MQLIRQLPAIHDRPTAVAIGNFDGLHLGHQAVLAEMVLAANAHHLVPSVLTFEPHPRRFFAPHAPYFRLKRLSTKLRRLRTAGVERVYMPHFNAAFAALTAEAFLQDVLATKLGARVVVTGEDFAFGKNRSGNVAMLRAWGPAHGMEVINVAAVMVDGVACSSSAVRQAIAGGDMAQAAMLLGRPYAIAGGVVHGDGRGAQLGFATANVALAPGLKLPAYGVYAVRALLHDKPHDGVANFGVRPTVAHGAAASLEVHLFDTPGMIYGERMEVQFIRKLRDERKFDSLAALTGQISEDCAAAKIALGQ
jgi:riboflavin kinase/FMN adenylyltransferase